MNLKKTKENVFNKMNPLNTTPRDLLNEKISEYLNVAYTEYITFIPSDFVTLAALEDEDVEMITGGKVRKPKEEERFVENSCYYLQNESIEGFEQAKRVFKLIKYVPTYKEAPIDSVIVKRVGDNHKGQMFTLTKSDCQKLGIKYENGLEIYPSSFPFVKCGQQERKKEGFEINNNDISRYPVSVEDNCIHKMIVQISGCRYINGYLKMPNGIIIEDDLRSLKVFVNNIGSVPFKCLRTNEMLEKRVNGVLDKNGMLYILIMLPRGIKPSSVNRVKLENFVKIKTKVDGTLTEAFYHNFFTNN